MRLSQMIYKHKLHQLTTRLTDEASLYRMDRVNAWGRKFLPPGFWGGQTQGQAKQLCLTFDDGPCPEGTQRLLELLAEFEVTATFFLLGHRISKHPQLVEQIARAGHVIGNHSYHHYLMPLLSVNKLEKEIDITNQHILDITGQQTILFRAPYGILDSRAAACLAERQMVPVYWGAVAEDWEKPGCQSVVNRIVKRMTPGNLLVLHERKSLAKQTIEATRGIIEHAREDGYDFVDVIRLMESCRE